MLSIIGMACALDVTRTYPTQLTHATENAGHDHVCTAKWQEMQIKHVYMPKATAVLHTALCNSMQYAMQQQVR
jgi:hypothetical protein